MKCVVSDFCDYVLVRASGMCGRGMCVYWMVGEGNSGISASNKYGNDRWGTARYLAATSGSERNYGQK